MNFAVHLQRSAARWPDTLALDDLPKSPYGDILKREVRARYGKDHDRAV